MMHRVQQFLNSKRCGGPAVAVVAVALFLMGLVVATDLNWTAAAEGAPWHQYAGGYGSALHTWLLCRPGTAVDPNGSQY